MNCPKLMTLSVLWYRLVTMFDVKMLNEPLFVCRLGDFRKCQSYQKDIYVWSWNVMFKKSDKKNKLHTMLKKLALYLIICLSKIIKRLHYLINFGNIYQQAISIILTHQLKNTSDQEYCYEKYWSIGRLKWKHG